MTPADPEVNVRLPLVISCLPWPRPKPPQPRPIPFPTRERILDAALELFATQGFDATSTAQIERAAGLSPRSGALYKHFRSKDELLEVALAQRMQEITALPDRLDLGPLSGPAL